MTIATRTVKREEILRLAIKSKLMLDAGNACCINDIAGEKELLAFARLLETQLTQTQAGSLVQSKQDAISKSERHGSGHSAPAPWAHT